MTRRARLPERLVSTDRFQAGSTEAQPPLPVPTPGACTILNVVPGPINLNLLGPQVATNEIRLVQVLHALPALAPRTAAPA